MVIQTRTHQNGSDPFSTFVFASPLTQALKQNVDIDTYANVTCAQGLSREIVNVFGQLGNEYQLPGNRVRFDKVSSEKDFLCLDCREIDV